MFFSEEVLVDSPAERTTERLCSWLGAKEGAEAAADAIAAGGRTIARAGFAGLSKTVKVNTLEPYKRGDVTVIVLRWSATGPFADLFPTLDADLEVSAAGPDLSRVALIGSYRPPLGPVGELLDRTVLHKAGALTIRHWLQRARAVATTANSPAVSPQRGSAPAARPHPLRNATERRHPFEELPAPA
jgi:hypothetical protein